MSGLGIAIFGLVAVVHLGDALLAGAFGLDRAWLFYVLRGLEGVFLYALLRGHASRLVRLAALWGIVESALTSVCGSLSMIKGGAANSPMGICSAQTGMPVAYYGSLITATLLALYLAHRRLQHGRP